MIGGPEQSVGVIVLISAIAAAMMLYALWTMFQKGRRGEKPATGEVIMAILLLIGIVTLAISNVHNHKG
jgi:hypothetical protein